MWLHGIRARRSTQPASPLETRAVVRTAAWVNMYVLAFTCEACGENQVPLTPDSNLEVSWDGNQWDMTCSSSGATSAGEAGLHKCFMGMPGACLTGIEGAVCGVVAPAMLLTTAACKESDL